MQEESPVIQPFSAASVQVVLLACSLNPDNSIHPYKKFVKYCLFFLYLRWADVDALITGIAQTRPFN